MGLIVKERQQRFRDNLKGDPDRLEAFKAKERKRYHDYKEIGMVKPINEMSERSKRSKRRRWRLSKNKERQRKKDIENSTSITSANTNRNSTTTHMFPSKNPNSVVKIFKSQATTKDALDEFNKLQADTSYMRRRKRPLLNDAK
ncbi:Hypothetical predicted protein [Mytilus galloprovincialis]|uniref:Uncharacterized protein n=1 Tax=Mytilus galloprovincialis TaxID=29158 RepID=A0A8B6CCQ3_MYTGA|nr:Hypothetical predicted protein [Mytilus galloprovincialis]